MSAPLAVRPPTEAAFAQAAHTPAQHFRLALFGVISRVIAACKDGDWGAAREAHPFLGDYLDQVAALFEIDASLQRRWQQALATWEARSLCRLPILSLLRCGVSRLQLDLILTVGLVEEDSRFGEVFEEARGRDRRPPFGLLLAWWREDDDGGDRLEEVQRALLDLIQMGLLQVQNPEAPRGDWLLCVPPPVWDALAGEPPRLRWAHFTGCESLPLLSAYIPPTEIEPGPEDLCRLLRDDPGQVVVVRGPHHNGRKTLVGSIARALGRGLLTATDAVLEDESRWRVFAALATLLDAVPLLDCDVAPGETKPLPALPVTPAPLFVVTTPRGAWSSAGVRPLLVHDLPIPGEDERRRHWETVLPGKPADELAALAAAARLVSGNIRRAAAAARSRAAFAGATSGRRQLALAGLRPSGSC